MKLCFSALALAVVVLTSIEVRAIGMMYPVGHLEALTAGTATAHLGSPAGLVYNPASLGGVHNSSLSMSGSSYYLVQAEFTSGKGQVNSLAAVPNSTIAAWKIGPGALSLGVFVPKNLIYSLKASFPGSIGDFNAEYAEALNVAGVAWGQKMLPSPACESCGLFGGVSLLGAYQTRKSTASVVNSDYNTVGIYNFDTSVTSVFATAGLIWHPSPGLSFGFTLQFPWIILNTTADGVVYNLRAPAGSVPTFTKTYGASNALTIERWNAAVGVQWRATPQVIWLADFALGESARNLSGFGSHAPILLGLAARYRFQADMAFVAGVKFDLSDFFPSSTEVQGFSLLTTSGIMWRKKDFETSLGAFYLKYFALRIPDGSRSPTTIGAEQILYLGAMLSGLYRF